MAKSRVIDTRFWIDDYICSLDPLEKLIFIYLLTNPQTDISGVYEIPLKHIVVDTSISIDIIEKTLKKLDRDGKVYFECGWVAIKNFHKYQNTNNPKILSGIKLGLNKAPKSLVDKLSISYPLVIGNLSHPNSNSNSNSNSNKIMYNYEDIDEEGNPVKKARLKKIDLKTNKFLISVGIMWRDMVKSTLNIPEKDIILLNIYYPIRACYDREKWDKEEFKKLFNYFLNDPRIKLEDKISFDLCLSQKYIAKYKLSQKSRPKTNSSISSEISL